MNRLDVPHYSIEREEAGGEEEDFPDLQVRGNVRNRNWYNVTFDEKSNVRLHKRQDQGPMHESGVLGHVTKFVPIFLPQVPGTKYDEYQGRGFVVEDFNCSISFRQPLSHVSGTLDEMVGGPSAYFAAEGIDVVSAIVVDHQYNGLPVLDIGQVWNLAGDASVNPSIPLRNDRPEYLERYEVLAYDVKRIKPRDLWSHSYAVTQYKVAEEPIPITTEYLLQVKYEIDEHARFACKDLHIPITLYYHQGNASPIGKQFYVIAYYRDPRNTNTDIFPPLTMDTEFQSRCYYPLE